METMYIPNRSALARKRLKRLQFLGRMSRIVAPPIGAFQSGSDPFDTAPTYIVRHLVAVAFELTLTI